MTSYVELVARSCYSLLHGASAPGDLVECALGFGMGRLAIADRDGVYGLPDAHHAAGKTGFGVICGATVTLKDGPPVVLLAETLAGWSQLCRLLTEGRAAEAKGRARVSTERLLQAAGGLSCLLGDGWTPESAGPLREAFGASLEVLVSRTLQPGDGARVAKAVALARALDRPLLATNDVIMHDASRRRVADVLTCIRRRCRLEDAGRALTANAERHLLSPAAFTARFADLPEAVARTLEVADRCAFRLDELRYTYPREVVPEGWTAMSWLRELVRRGIVERYPDGAPDTVHADCARELDIIEQLDFPSYFLTVHDVVRWARDRNILCQGRGSAANSTVCYVLGITAVHPGLTTLLFERFISVERKEPPDIDVDFEHERREEVIQYVYERYGRHRAAMVNEMIAWRPRSAIRDVGKVFGLSLDQVDRLASMYSHWSGVVDRGDLEQVRTIGLDPTSPAVRWTLQVAQELVGLPRHLGIHSGGFVIADQALADLVPVEPATMEDRTVVQWDKYGVEGLRFVKVDLLSLGMLTAIRKSFDLVERAYGQRWALHSLPQEDPAVYKMFGAADTVGVFQIESRAQQSMLPRLRPMTFYDLVIEVSIVRPGPIQGGMVHPYLRRRNKEEEVSYVHPALKKVLGRTLGVPLFQEQVMQIAVEVGGFTPGEADGLRRAMGAWRKRGGLDAYGDRLKAGMAERGIPAEFADAVFQQILGFGEYGFPESHAASFALLVYASGWLKLHYPEAFCAALINSQPMGFYSPRALVADAQRHGVVARPVDVQQSDWDCTLEPQEGRHALRLGLRMVRGLSEEAARAVERARQERPFHSLEDLAWRTRLDRRSLGLLSDAGALRSLVDERRQAAWMLQGLWTELPLFAGVARQEPPAELPEETEVEELVADYRAVGLSLERHPGVYLRQRLAAEGRPTLAAAELVGLEAGARVRVAGLVSSRQRPGTAKGVVFISLEDETGMINLILWPKVWAAYEQQLRQAVLICVEGRLQKQDGAVSVLVESGERVDGLVPVEARSRDFH